MNVDDSHAKRPAVERLGFMQGRLSPMIDGKIQAFPWAAWQVEFPAAARLGLKLIEWTLDHERLSKNPIMSEYGRREIRALAEQNGVSVAALTGDLFMQAPFWKAAGAQRETLIAEFDAVIEAAAALDVGVVVVPLVDNGSLETTAQEAVLFEVLAERATGLRRRDLRVAFESDYEPDNLRRLIERLPTDVYAINYDIGNSAALGYDCGEEIAAYGDRIAHVHVKDRVRGGTTVPLGTGAAEIGRAIRLLEQSGYTGNYVLQTARAADGDHAGALARYQDMTLGWIAAGT